MVIATGGCYPALAVVSSNMFGHPLTSSGLTQFELRTHSSIRIWNTVVFENVPQLCFQILYVTQIGIEDYVLLAFLASILSVFVSTLSFLIGRDVNGMIPVEYHLAVQCTRRPKSPSPQPIQQRLMVVKPHRKLPMISLPSASLASMQSPNVSTILQTHPSFKDAVNLVTDSEEAGIMANRGRTRRLAKKLSGLYGIQPKALEIGATLCTKHGFTTHCVQFVDGADLEAMRDELADANHGVTDISAEQYLDRKFEAAKDNLAQAVRSHFNLSRDFEVKLTQNRDKRGRNAGGTQARLRLALNDFFEDDSRHRCDVVEEKAQSLLEALGRNFVDQENDFDSRTGGDAVEQPAQLQMVGMGTRDEDREDALCESGTTKDDKPSSEDHDEQRRFSRARTKDYGSHEQRRRKRSHSVSTRCNDEDCDYQDVDTLEDERLEILYKSISTADQEHFRMFHSWS